MKASDLHLGAAELLDYWLGDCAAALEAEREEHLFACRQCARSLQALVELGDALRALVRNGGATAVVPPSFADTLKASGLRVNEYRVEPNGSVNCSIAPNDDLVVSRLQAPLRDVKRLDVIVRTVETNQSMRLQDVAFDASRQEVTMLPKARELRQCGIATQRVELVAVTAAGDRTLGEYVFHHTPYGA